MTGAMIFGTADASAIARLASPLHPVRTGDGRAYACLWLSDFEATTVGPYRELTVTFLATHKPLTLPWVNGFSPLAAQLHPSALISEYVLLLDNQDAIDYGKELHGFDKRHGGFELTRRDGRFSFSVTESLSAGSPPVVDGEINELGLLSQPAALRDIVAAHGFVPTLKLLAAPHVRMPVVTPNTVRALRSDLYFRGDFRLQAWAERDRLRFGDAPVGKLLQSMGFMPTAVHRVLSGQGLMPLALGAVETVASAASSAAA